MGILTRGPSIGSECRFVPRTQSIAYLECTIDQSSCTCPTAKLGCPFD